MRTLVIAAAIAALPCAAFAQTPRAYINGAGGFATTPDGTSGNVVSEVGVQVARNLFVFGNLGRFHDLQPSAEQPAVDSTTATLSSIGIDVAGKADVPAWYTSGGARFEIPASKHVIPYVFGSVGLARITPHATFAYESGTLGDTTPTTGADVTSQVVALGDFTQPPASNALMISGGGGVEAPIAKRVLFDASYRLSRVDADTPLHTQGLTFGIGYRF